MGDLILIGGDLLGIEDLGELFGSGQRPRLRVRGLDATDLWPESPEPVAYVPDPPGCYVRGDLDWRWELFGFDFPPKCRSRKWRYAKLEQLWLPD